MSIRASFAQKFVLLLMCVVAASAQDAVDRKQEILWQKLDASLKAMDAKFDGVMGVALIDLKTGRELLLHADEVFPTASSIKIAILAELFHQHQQAVAGAANKAKLTDRYTIRQEDLVGGSGILGGFTPGVTQLTNRDLVTLMVAVSDNSATNILMERVGVANVNTLLDGLSLRKTRLQRKMMDTKAAEEGRENVATPHELARLLAEIHAGKVLNAEMTKDFFEILSTPKSSQIPRLLPESIKIANKPGELNGVRCDVGIVFVPDRPFAISVMTTYDRDGRQAESMISEIALLAYRHFETLAVSSEYGREMRERRK